MDVFNVKGGVFVFLHLGENVVVPVKDVIGIFDIQTAMYSSDTIQFLITDGKPKSFVIAEIDKMSKVYLSPISSSTLTKRTDINYNP